MISLAIFVEDQRQRPSVLTAQIYLVSISTAGFASAHYQVDVVQSRRVLRVPQQLLRHSKLDALPIDSHQLLAHKGFVGPLVRESDRRHLVPTTGSKSRA